MFLSWEDGQCNGKNQDFEVRPPWLEILLMSLWCFTGLGLIAEMLSAVCNVPIK